MIVTLTANPSIDRTITLTSPLVRGEVLRAASVTSQAGGKGVNISRAAVAAGVRTIAVLPATKDDPYVLELLTAGVDCRPEPPAGPVRVNVTITEPDGTTTKINSPGATVTTQSLDRLAAALLQRAQQAAWVVLAGSLPPGAPTDWYSALNGALRRTTAKVAVDTSGEPLAKVAQSLGTVAPDLLKPNAEELAYLTGSDAAAIESDPGTAAKAGRHLVDQGVGAVLATLGGSGAVLVTGAGAWHATPPPTRLVSTVGAGDSSLFGYLLADLRGDGPADRLRTAVAYGSAAAGLPGSTVPTPEDIQPEHVVVRELVLP